MKALLSIKPEFAEAIFNGEKKFEYRKVIFKEKVKYIQVYVTKPIGKIIGDTASTFSPPACLRHRAS